MQSLLPCPALRLPVATAQLQGKGEGKCKVVSREGSGLPDQVIFESALKSSGQGGRARPTAQPGWRLRLAGWVSLSLGQAGLDSTPEFPR